MKKTGHLAEIKIRQGAYLPHWTRDGAVYAVTFRLADSLPESVVRSWKFERLNILTQLSQLRGYEAGK
jgi:menaquinone-specific isochorismate synthase